MVPPADLLESPAVQLMLRALEHLPGKHPQDSHGGDGPGIGVLDKLKLGKRAPAGFAVRSSKKLKTDTADVAVAEVDGPDGLQVRVGLITTESGRWDAGFTGEARKAQLRQHIAEKQALFDSADEQNDDLEDEIIELEREQEALDEERTAIVTPEVMASLRDRLGGEGLALAKANKAKQDATLKRLDTLDDKRGDIIAELGDADLEQKISKLSGFRRGRQDTIKSLENDPDTLGWGPAKIAEYIELHKARLAEQDAELAPLLARRAELMPPDALARLEDLDRQTHALTEGDIDDIITSVEAPTSNGARVVAEIWGSDDVDSDWVTTRLYVLKPGETTDDADNEDGYAYLRGLRGLNKLVAGFDTSAATKDQASRHPFPLTGSPAVRLMLFARSLEGTEFVKRGGKLVKISRGAKGRFGDTVDVPSVKPERKPRAASVAKALLSGDTAALDGFNREQLRREAGKRAITLKRGASEDAIKDALWDHEQSGVDDEADLPGGEKAQLDLARMTVPQLKERAKASGITGYSKMRKAELVDRMAGDGPADLPSAGTAPAMFAVTAQLETKRANPQAGDRQAVDGILKPLTAAQLDQVALDNDWQGSVRGTKEQKRGKLVELLVGARLSSNAIMARKQPSPPQQPGPQSDALTRRIKQIDEAMDEVDGPARGRLDVVRKELVKQRAELGSPQPAPAPAKAPRKARDIMKSGSSPAKPPTGPNREDHEAIMSWRGGLAQQLKDLPIEPSSEDKARAMLAGLKAPELKALAKELGPTVSQKGGKKADMIEDIVMGTVGFKLRAAARGGFGEGSWQEINSAGIEREGGSFLDKPKTRPGDLTAAGRIAAAQLAEDNPIGPAVTARRMAEMRAREGSAKEIGNSPELQAAVEEQMGDWAARTRGRRDPGRPARVLGGIEEPANASDTYIMAHLVTNKANLGMRQTQPYFIAVPRDRFGSGGPQIVSDPDQIPAGTKRFFETTVSGDIYENDRDTGQRRWIGRIKPEEVLPRLEEGPQPEHRRRADDAGMTEWHNFTKRERWDRESGTWMDEGETAKPKLSRGSTGMTSKMETVLQEIDDSGGLEMKKADFQTEYGLSDREMRRLLDDGLIEVDDKAGPGYIGLTDAGLAAIRKMTT